MPASRIAKRPERVVALTGASSFLGTHLLTRLDSDESVARVVTLDVRAPRIPCRKFKEYAVDLTVPAAGARLEEILATEGVDSLVHLAFLATPTHAEAWAHELESVGTMHVMVAARQAGVKKLVMSSSTLLYGAHPSNPNFLTEAHPLRAPAKVGFFADKLDAEREALRFAERNAGSTTTVLRLAPMVGPTVQTLATAYFGRRVAPTMMGFDPLIQLLHEADAVDALVRAMGADVPGTFNVAADGVLPLSTALRIVGAGAAPVPHPVAEPLVAAAWLAQASPAPPAFLRYLRFLCVADTRKARDELGFAPAFTTRSALEDFARARQSAPVSRGGEDRNRPASERAGSVREPA